MAGGEWVAGRRMGEQGNEWQNREMVDWQGMGMASVKRAVGRKSKMPAEWAAGGKWVDGGEMAGACWPAAEWVGGRIGRRMAGGKLVADGESFKFMYTFHANVGRI